MNKGLCPCGSEREYQTCCQPYHQGEAQAQHPELLMRSRYSAYVMRLSDYLLATWHESTRPSSLALDEGVQWLGLKVLESGEQEDAGYVEFIARFKQVGRAQRLHERSRFVCQAGRWFYLDGEFKDTPKEVKTGRNVACPCGSGKKYKRCCGSAA